MWKRVLVLVFSLIKVKWSLYKARRDTLVLPAFLLALVFSSTTPPFHDVVSCVPKGNERTRLPVASTDSTIEPPIKLAEGDSSSRL